MPRIAPLPSADATGKARELLDALQLSLGATPNMAAAMARSSVLEGWMGLSQALRRGAVSGPDGERIALGVAEYNRCTYCLSVHTYLGERLARLDPDELEKARHFESADPRSAAVLAFAEAVVHTAGGVADGDVEAARGAGLSDAELSDIVGHVAANVLTNYFNKAFETEVDFPVVEPHRDAVAR